MSIRNKYPEIIDLSTFRHDHIFGEDLAHWHARHVGVIISTDPWLTIKRSPVALGRVVIAHSGRYRNLLFRWKDVLRKYPKALFVGLPQEHATFCAENRVNLDYHPTTNLLELAEVIAGCDKLVCNQSLPFWLGLGIGVSIYQETFIYSPNSTIPRPNAFYSRDHGENTRLLAAL